MLHAGWRRGRQTPIITLMIRRSRFGRRPRARTCERTIADDATPSDFGPRSSPSTAQSCWIDELLLSGISPDAVHAAHHGGQVQARSHPKKSHASVRVTPAQEINKLYAQFLAMFRLVEQSYVQTLSNQFDHPGARQHDIDRALSAGSASIQVANPAVFGPEGAFAAPIIATAVIGAPVGTFSLIGSNSTQVAVNTASSSAVSLSNGTLLTASVPTTNTTSAGAIFPSYISASTQQLAVQLVAYFNSLPFKLPRMFAFPHQNQRSGGSSNMSTGSSRVPRA